MTRIWAHDDPPRAGKGGRAGCPSLGPSSRDKGPTPVPTAPRPCPRLSCPRSTWSSTKDAGLGGSGGTGAVVPHRAEGCGGCSDRAPRAPEARDPGMALPGDAGCHRGPCHGHPSDSPALHQARPLQGSLWDQVCPERHTNHWAVTVRNAPGCVTRSWGAWAGGLDARCPPRADTRCCARPGTGPTARDRSWVPWTQQHCVATSGEELVGVEHHQAHGSQRTVTKLLCHLGLTWVHA